MPGGGDLTSYAATAGAGAGAPAYGFVAAADADGPAHCTVAVCFLSPALPVLANRENLLG